MVLTQEEAIGKLRHEGRILFHRISQVDVTLVYRPTPKQPGRRELLRYFRGLCSDRPQNDSPRCPGSESTARGVACRLQSSCT